eukprot:2773493-Rhodomonas_salina.2
MASITVEESSGEGSRLLCMLQWRAVVIDWGKSECGCTTTRFETNSVVQLATHPVSSKVGSAPQKMVLRAPCRVSSLS